MSARGPASGKPWSSYLSVYSHSSSAMQPRFCYAVRFDGDWSPSLAVWATDSHSALRIAAQTDIGRPTGAVEMFTPVAWGCTFGRLPGWEYVDPMMVLYGPGDGFYHRYRGKLYKMSATGTFQNP